MSPGDGHAFGPWTIREEAIVCGFGVKSSRLQSGLCWVSGRDLWHIISPACAFLWSSERVQQAEGA